MLRFQEYDWPPDLVHRLITEVKKRPVIWSRRTEFASEFKRISWDEVARGLNVNCAVVLAKWDNLLRTYSQVIFDQRANGRLTNWLFFDRLSFLEDELPYNENVNTGTPFKKPRLEESEVKVTLEKIEFENLSDDEIDTNPSVLRGLLFGDFNYNTIQNNTTNITGSVECLDDISFFNRLLPHVKTLPSDKKMFFRRKVQELMNKLICENVAENTERLSVNL
ncbi:uncharacterized protein LOC143917113 [Arctopsyche grandis]|uniref:uncharacterized protein LOC143917113 n=1 Tax=Arctopsyche grandis TaxID=121162 RepID=UPI00406D6EB4